MNRVFDERFPDFAMFEGSAFECAEFMSDNFDELDEDFEFVWMEELV